MDFGSNLSLSHYIDVLARGKIMVGQDMIGRRHLIQLLFATIFFLITLELFYRQCVRIEIYQMDRLDFQSQNSNSESQRLHSKIHQEPGLVELPPGREGTIKYILRYSFYKKDDPDPFNGCPISNCYMTNNHSILESIAMFDAILIHPFQFRSNKQAFKLMRELHPLRHPRQRWIADMTESPRWDEVSFVNREFLSRFNVTEVSSKGLHNQGTFFVSRNVFNWTISVWPDSDIWRLWHYTFVKQFPDNLGPFWDKSPTHFGEDSVPSLNLEEKTGLVFWVVSHCPTMSKREIYVKALQRFIPVDIYGRCGNMTGCPKQEGNACHKRLARKYKFYLAFENAVCQDYVTEKFTDTIFYPTVPVVLGGSDYKSWAPDHSYVNVFDFPNPKALAEYLIHLDKNNDDYLKYFDWKSQYVGFRRGQMGNCELCAKLHDPTEPKKMIKDLYDWWYHTNTGERVCKWIDKPLQFYSSRNNVLSRMLST